MHVLEFCRKNDISFVTKGSANNSVVNALLGITQINPLEAASFDFSRFISMSRIGLPDIDIEVGYNEREKVLQFLRNEFGSSSIEGITIRTIQESDIKRL